MTLMKESRMIKLVTSQTPLTYGVSLFIFIAVGFIGFGSYKYYTQSVDLKYTQIQLNDLTENSNQNILILREKIQAMKDENTGLYSSLEAEQTRNNQFSVQVESMSTVVGQLYKLSKTDRELLQKYSNIYFLNENYTPSQLSEIDATFLLRKTKSETIHSNIKPYLENMLKAATADSMPILVLSAYRSFGTQAALKTGYKVTYGTTAANKFSADQGYSEHQLGSTADFTTPTGGETLNGFDKTDSFKWMTQNAYKYGFILSYPKGNKFYQYEPWHWRFVGVELATKMHQESKNFYDMDQREINDFLVKIFD